MKILSLLFSILLCSQVIMAQWEVVSNGEFSDIKSIDFPSNEIGYACGDQFIIKTVDGGNSWDKTNTEYYLNAIDFPSENVGYAVGNDSTFLKTINAGETWTKLPTPYIWEYMLNYNDVKFINDSVGFIAAGGYYTGFEFEIWWSKGYIFKTMDGGHTWEITHHGETSVNSLSIAKNTNTINAVGGVYTPGNYHERILVQSEDSGDTWNTIETNIEYSYSSVECLDEQNLILSNGKQVYYSSDGANSFQQFNIDTILNNGYIVNYNHYLLIGPSGNIFHSPAYTTAFNKVDIDEFDNNLFDVTATENGTIFITGSDGLIIRNQNISSIEQNYQYDISISLYPNPTNNEINIDFEIYGKYEVNIYNIRERILSKTITSNTLNIDISQLPNGTYIVEVKSKKGKSIKKLLKL